MCLIATHRKPKIAKEDIKCWKQVRCNSINIFTPFRSSIIHSKWLLADGKPKKAVNPILYYFFQKRRYIEEGYIHAYTLHITAPLVYTVSCIIPKGTEYWEDEIHHEICAREMIITSNQIGNYPISKFKLSNCKSKLFR